MTRGVSGAEEVRATGPEAAAFTLGDEVDGLNATSAQKFIPEPFVLGKVPLPE
jgi:hypothetical protein